MRTAQNYRKMPKQKKKTNAEFLDDSLEEKEVKEAAANPDADGDDLDEELLDLDEGDDIEVAGGDDEEVGY